MVRNYFQLLEVIGKIEKKKCWSDWETGRGVFKIARLGFGLTPVTGFRPCNMILIITILLIGQKTLRTNTVNT